MDNMDEIKNTNNENNTNNLNESSEIIDTNKEKSEEVKQVSKANFVPAYQKAKNENTSENKKNVKKDKKDKKERKVKSKISVIIISLLLIAIISVIAVLSYNMLNKDKISDYDKLMDDYGLSTLYNNQTSNPSEKVEKSEALKVIIASTLNTTNITEYMSRDMLYEDPEIEVGEETDTVNLYEILEKIDSAKKLEEVYQNEYYVRYALSINFLNKDEITEENYNSEITYIEAIKYLSYAKNKLLGKNLDVDNTPSFKNYDSFSSEEKWALADAVYNGIIEDSKSKFNGNITLTKQKLNELIVKFVRKYNLITINDEKININEDKMPSNKDEFTYTLSSINKEIYEIPTYKANENYKNSRETFVSIKEYYELINQIVEKHYNTLLNIDYETITQDDFYFEITTNTTYVTTEEDVAKYIEYVKENKIKVTGTSKVQNPIIYFDGENYRVRTKLTYNIENAENLKNIFINDVDNTYEKGEEVIYIDAVLTTNETLTRFYVVPTTITNMISGEITNK